MKVFENGGSFSETADGPLRPTLPPPALHGASGFSETAYR